MNTPKPPDGSLTPLPKKPLLVLGRSLMTPAHLPIMSVAVRPLWSPTSLVVMPVLIIHPALKSPLYGAN